MQRPQFLLHKRHLSEFPFKVDFFSNSMQLTLISYEYTYVYPLSLRSFYATRPGPVPGGGIPRHGRGGRGVRLSAPLPFCKILKKKKLYWIYALDMCNADNLCHHSHSCTEFEQKNGNSNLTQTYSTLTLRLVTLSLSYLIRMGNVNRRTFNKQSPMGMIR